VLVAVTSADPSQATVSPSLLVFDTATWALPQPVTVSAVDDAIDDGDASVVVSFDPSSDDPAYGSVTTVNTTFTVRDDDTAGLVVTPVDGLTTTESGGTDTFTVRLASRPTAAVRIDLRADDDTEGTVQTP